MVLLCAAIWRDSFLRFTFLNHVEAFLREISLVCPSKYPHSCFSSPFYFLTMVVLLIIVLLVLFLVGVVSIFWLFYVVFGSSYRYINAVLQCWLVLVLLLFLTHTACLMYRHEFFFSLVHVLNFFSRPLQGWSRVFYKEHSESVYLFDEISIV